MSVWKGCAHTVDGVEMGKVDRRISPRGESNHEEERSGSGCAHTVVREIKWDCDEVGSS